MNGLTTNVKIDLFFNEENGHYQAFFLSKTGKKEVLTGNAVRERSIAKIADPISWSDNSNFQKKVKRKFKNPITISFAEVFGEAVSGRTFAGLQTGQASMDDLASNTDTDVKAAVPRVWKLFAKAFPIEAAGSYHQRKLSREDVQKLGCSRNFGSEPDGGIIFNKDGLPIIAFEAKKQGGIGNAFERWFKNFHTLQCLNPNIAMVTFLVGLGCSLDKNNRPYGMRGVAEDAMAVESYKRQVEKVTFDVYNREVPSFYCSITGFQSDELEDIIMTILKTHFNVNN